MLVSPALRESTTTAHGSQRRGGRAVRVPRWFMVAEMAVVVVVRVFPLSMTTESILRHARRAACNAKFQKVQIK